VMHLCCLTCSDTKALDTANDILVGGLLAHTFSPQGADNFFTLLFRTSNYLRYYCVSYVRWHMTQNVTCEQQPSLGAPTQNVPLPLDFSVKMTPGTVVPQRRWIPANGADVRHVGEARVQLPIFVDRNGGAGFWLPDILQGRNHDLHNRDSQAQLGGRATTHIRINVSSYALILAAKILIHASRCPS